MSRRRIRSIKPEFFGDEDMTSMSIQARYLAAGLISLADDRGRLRDRPLEILGAIFPEERVSLQQVRKWLDEIVKIRFAVRYRAGDHSYLWLPNFLRHQVIPKPTESELPPHPDDALAEFPILTALKQAKLQENDGSPTGELPENYCSSPVDLHDEYCRTRGSTPIPSIPIPSTTKDGVVDKPARTKSRSVDPDSLPRDFPERLTPILDDPVLPTLLRLWEERGGKTPTRRGAALALRAHPDRDHAAELGSFEHYFGAGKGANASIVDWGLAFRKWLAKADPASPIRAAAIPPASPRDERKQRNAEVLRRVMGAADVDG